MIYFRSNFVCVLIYFLDFIVNAKITDILENISVREIENDVIKVEKTKVLFSNLLHDLHFFRVKVRTVDKNIITRVYILKMNLNHHQVYVIIDFYVIVIENFMITILLNFGIGFVEPIFHLIVQVFRRIIYFDNFGVYDRKILNRKKIFWSVSV